MKKENLFRIMLSACLLVLLIAAAFGCAYGLASYYDKPVGEVPLWYWFLFM